MADKDIPDNPPFTPIDQIGEFGLIDRMHAIIGEPANEDVLIGIDDDAAVYRVGEGIVHILTTDALIEGVHFDLSFTPMEYLGFKSISVNVSDIAAMNGLPLYATIALGIPNNVSVEMIEAFYGGVKKAGELYGLSLLGGDTTGARRLTISVTVVGEAAEDAVVYRSGAQPGDLLCVTGNIGAAYAGLKVLLDQKRMLQEMGEEFSPSLQAFPYVIQRQLTPTARTNIIKSWAQANVRPHALIDISDGLASEVHHICRLSGCGARVYAAALPIDLETRQVADEFAEDVDTYALFGGEDYELLFAIPEENLEQLEEESFSVVGEFTPPEEGITIELPEGGTIPLEAQGYQHFGRMPGNTPPE